MKDANLIKNYRLKYKRYFGIEFDENYVVHHIDFNRENNDISNLLLLPKELHAKYHLIVNSISINCNKKKADGFIDVRISNSLIAEYNWKMFRLLPDVIAECQKWYEWKFYRYSAEVKDWIFK